MRFILLTLALTLTACGFTPLNSKATLVDERTSTILIMPIADRPGQMLHNNLRNKLTPGGMPLTPDYKLVVTMTKASGAVGGRPTAQSTRSFLSYTAKFSLKDARNNRIIYSDTASSRVHYADYTRIYDTKSADDAAERNGLSLLADNIASAISLRLARI